MARRRFGRPSVRVARRMTDWQFASGVPVGLISCASGTTAVLGTVAIAEGGTMPGTLVRIRANVHIEIASETAAATLQGFGVAVGLFDDKALAVSTGAGTGLPNPISDADSEKFMWVEYGYVGIGPDIAIAATPESDGSGRRISVDLVVAMVEGRVA